MGDLVKWQYLATVGRALWKRKGKSGTWGLLFLSANGSRNKAAASWGEECRCNLIMISYGITWAVVNETSRPDALCNLPNPTGEWGCACVCVRVRACVRAYCSCVRVCVREPERERAFIVGGWVGGLGSDRSATPKIDRFLLFLYRRWQYNGEGRHSNGKRGHI